MLDYCLNFCSLNVFDHRFSSKECKNVLLIVCAFGGGGGGSLEGQKGLLKREHFYTYPLKIPIA